MDKMELTDLSQIPPHRLLDYTKRNANIIAGRVLCERCSGTGNELLSMYRKCSACDGRGFIQEVRSGNKIKIFEMNDYEWYAGETLSDCVTAMCQNQECTEDECYNGDALTDKQMDDLQYWYDDPDGQTVSFRERLNEMIANGDKFPCFFASTEY